MGRRKKRKLSGIRKPAGLILALAGFLLLGFLSITTSRLGDKFHKGAEYAKSLFFSRGKVSPLVPSPPDILNEEEKRLVWAQEFDSALQTALLSDKGLHPVTLSGSEQLSLLPLKRVIECRQTVPWTKIRRVVLDLVQARGGKVFTSHEEKIPPSHRRITFFLGSKETTTASYILVFQIVIPAQAPSAVGKKAKPVIALVIDDLGYHRQMARDLFSLDLTLTVSILPNHPFSRECAQLAHDRSWEIILHLPMQPRQCASAYWEKNTLLVSMSKEEIVRILDSCLRNVPWVMGVNNHMGSLMMEDRRSMQVILEELKSRGLYFLDSRTTQRSIGYELAQALEVPSAFRQVFLDNEKTISSIKRQIDLLIDKALKDGQAVGIGHLHPATIQALKESVPKFREKGITLVKLSELVE